MEIILYIFNTDIFWFIGRWYRNSMMRYLHTSVQTFTAGLVTRMVQHGDYALIPPTHKG